MKLARTRESGKIAAGNRQADFPPHFPFAGALTSSYHLIFRHENIFPICAKAEIVCEYTNGCAVGAAIYDWVALPEFPDISQDPNPTELTFNWRWSSCSCQK